MDVSNSTALDLEALAAHRSAPTDGDRLIQGVLARTPAGRVALRRDLVTEAEAEQRVRLDTWPPTHQGKSGRCWIFAGLNLLRRQAAAAMRLNDFEFSQSHVMYWDKLERANYVLEAFADTAALSVDDRTVGFLLDNLANDGGQWHMFVALVRKHGLVPLSAMPETVSSKDTQPMNQRLRTVLRRGAIEIRALKGDRPSIDRTKYAVLGAVDRILRAHLGDPPTMFTWQWRDDEGEFHRDEATDPIGFATRYVDLPLEDFVCLVNDPRPERRQAEALTVRYLGNVIEATPVVYVNADVATMRSMVIATLEQREPVWFGCDTDKMVDDASGLWDAALYDYESLYRTAFGLSKADRVTYHESRMTHAMVFTGFDDADGAVARWRVENSWGRTKGRNGFYVMNDNWFAEYVFEIAVRRELLPSHLHHADRERATVLEPWDPMGALAA